MRKVVATTIEGAEYRGIVADEWTIDAHNAKHEHYAAMRDAGKLSPTHVAFGCTPKLVAIVSDTPWSIGEKVY